MEANALDHNTRSFLSFDSPQTGANIPLGIQYWLAFFADQSADAAAWLTALDSPAARQMLAYHHTDPPGTVPTSDALRAEFLDELAALGDYPMDLRKVAIANGSAAGADQGYPAGDQIIQWEYSSFLIDIVGNVWAVPDGGPQLIFEGLIDPILLPPEEMNVTVNGALPYDNAPGGWRSSIAEIDAAEAPYGDIVALNDNHCFIPTISALALSTDDLFYDVAGDPNILDRTPFDVVYFPMENQEHVAITPESAEWFLYEVLLGAAGIEQAGLPPSEMPALRLASVNPFDDAVRFRFRLPGARHAFLAVHDAAGRRVRVLANGSLAEGEHLGIWDGRDAAGRRVGPGVYFVHLRSPGLAGTKKVVLR
jgi:hypothetical protein